MNFFKWCIKKEHITTNRKKKKEPQDGGGAIQPFNFLPTAILLSFCVLAVFICFVGQSPAGPQVVPNYLSKVRVVADFPFSYLSQVKTKRLQEQKRLMVAPVYSVNMEIFKNFYQVMQTLIYKLDDFEKQVEGQNKVTDITQNIYKMVSQFNIAYDTHFAEEDIINLLATAHSVQRNYMINEGLSILGDIMRRGVYNFSEFQNTDQQGSYLLNIRISDNYKNASSYQSEEEALRFLRLNLSVLDPNLKTVQSLFRILKTGVVPNIKYDDQKTKENIEAIISSVDPVTVFVERGQVIIHSGAIVNPDDYEQWQAYRLHLKAQEEHTFGFNIFLMQRVIATLLIVFTTILYIKIALPDYKSSKRYRILPALLILINLLLIRFLIEVGEASWMPDMNGLVTLLPFAAPIGFAPILTTLLIGSTPAVLVAILVSAFNTLMQGTDLSFFFIYSLSTLVAIYIARNTRKRKKVLYAGLISGFIFGLVAGLVNIFEHFYTSALIEQVVITTIVGGMSSILATGIRPVLENLFGITTDFTLLELTDFNHPLLRRLQLEAPGTYHHSIMVANLSEKAALQIDANPLLCRTASLFHDIGKLIKPEYFIENQQEGVNPHSDINPSISAIIIKSHIKEGLELAREARLPKPIIDAIKEHHGTTYIQYFYNKALKQCQEQFSSDGECNHASVDKANFRYEGPKPQTRENAIMFFADSVEAASRSLKKISHQSITEMVNSIFEERISEHQLDESPLTLSEIYAIKDSFIFTLVNMLHSRISYNKEQQEV